MKIQIKNLEGNLIFEHDCENNSLAITVQKALKQKISFQRADFRGADCKGVSFKKANCWETSFYNADCRKASFDNADCWRASFYNANCQEASFDDADCWRALFDNADCRKALFDNADCWRASFKSTNLTLVDLTKIKCPPLYDHCFISEVLIRAAETQIQKDFATAIKTDISDEKCWEYFYEIAKEQNVLDWAEKVLGQWKEYKKKILRIKKEL